LNQARTGSIVRPFVPLLRRPRLSVLALVLTAAVAHALSSDLERALKDSQYVYIQSERQSGAFGKPAEIWFMYDGGAVLVGTPPSSWRVKRIKAGRRRARIAVGKVDGPAFEATGEVVKDAALEARLLDEFGRKYPEGWKRFADRFRDGFKSGDRVLVRYTPTGEKRP
jgi:hypothetical protein